MDREKVKSAIVEISLSVEPFQTTLIEPTAINFFMEKTVAEKQAFLVPSRMVAD